MSHHGENPFHGSGETIKYLDDYSLQNEINKHKSDFSLSNAINKQEGRNPYEPSKNIGATNEFPDGKLNEDDKGGIKFACTIQDGRLIMNFGEKPITWIGFTKADAKNLAEYILEKLDEIK